MDSKLCVTTYKIHSTGLPAHPSHHINPRETQTLSSSDTGLLSTSEMTYIVSSGALNSTHSLTRTELAKHAFRCSAPSLWNSLPSFIINSGSLTTFKSRLKTYFFHLSFDCSVHVWPHHIPAGAPEVTTLWHYVNQFIIIIL